jgi:alpha-tubulin suppressor-like RCC1 family protein
VTRFACAFLLLSLAAAAACERDATQVLVWVDVAAGSTLETRATAMRVRVLDGQGNVVSDETRTIAGPTPEVALPASISLVPFGGDASRRFRVEVSLLEPDAMGLDVEIAKKVADGGFVDHELREIWLLFDDACIGVSCGPGRTCIEGACRRACFDGRPPGETTPSVPGACPCDCPCDGDTCVDGFCQAPTRVVTMDLGYAHACAIDDRERLLCWGRNDRGQLGLGAADAEVHDRPSEVVLPMRPTLVALGAAHTCVALEDSSVWCWGANDLGQLGTTDGDLATPTEVTRPDGSGFGRVLSLGAGVGHTCVASDGGGIACFGDNSSGQLGMGMAGMPLPPTDAVAPPSAPDVALHLGEVHSCAVQPGIGRLFCWGSDHDWQLGFEDGVDVYVPTQVYVDDDPARSERFTAAAAGGWHTCGLVNDGDLYCWGEDEEGRIGMVSTADVTVPTPVFPDRVFKGVALGAGRRHTCVIAEDGSMQCMGTRGNGELGIGREVPPTPTPFELRDDGWQSVALGESFTCAVRSGGALYCWGLNAYGQLGRGGTDDAWEPARVCLPGV